MLPVLPLKRRGTERHLLLGLAKPHCQPDSGGISIPATGKAGGSKGPVRRLRKVCSPRCTRAVLAAARPPRKPLQTPMRSGG